MAQENERQDNSGDARIRDNLVQTMTRKFGDVCRDWLFTVWKSKLRRVRIDATPARWRGDVGSSPLDGASAATSSPRN